MAGMLQILTYMFGFYLVVKGIEVLQIGLSSNRENRKAMIILGSLTLAACLIAAFAYSNMQDSQASSLNTSAPTLPTP